MTGRVRWRRAGSEDRELAAVLAFGGFSVAGVAVAAGRLLGPGILAAAPACPFHAWTGLPCPGCGSTRAVLALLSGEPLSALALNPLATLALSGCLFAALAAPLWTLARGPIPLSLGPGGAGWLRAGVLLAVGLNWIYVIVQRV